MLQLPESTAGKGAVADARLSWQSCATLRSGPLVLPDRVALWWRGVENADAVVA